MTSTPWLTAPQAAAALAVSISTLYRWRTQGLLVAGKDWMRKFPSANSPVLYHRDRVEQRMAQLTATTADAIEPAIRAKAAAVH
jgi:predicted site-specific integrase-resolvase